MPIETAVSGPITWINITHPTPADLQALGRLYPGFHPLHLQDCLTEQEVPKLDHFDAYVFLVVQVPAPEDDQRVYRPAEVDIFLTRTCLVTAHRGDLPRLDELFQEARAAGLAAAQLERGASPLLYRLLNALVNDCFPLVQRTGTAVRELEGRVFGRDQERSLQEIALLRREIISLRSILKAQTAVLEALIRGTWPFIHEELDPYWGDISDHLTLLCGTLDQYAEVVSGLSDTIDTLASHRIDGLVRLLTIVTVLTLPLTLLATLFGMNIVIPGSDHPLLFFGLLLLGFGASLGLILYLRRRKWL